MPNVLVDATAPSPLPV